MEASRPCLRLIGSLLVLLACVLALSVPPSAEAAFPGANGKIVFEHDGDVVVMNPDGTARQTVGFGHLPRWSPDGKRIAYVGDAGIYIMNADGSAPRWVTAGGGWGIAWSPDATKLVLTRDDPDNRNLWLTNVAGTTQTLLGPGSRPSWSPDGSQIAFSEEPGVITIMKANGSGRRTLTSGDDQWFPTWSPDGRKLVFWGNPTGVALIKVIRSDGSGEKTLTQGQDPAWSPDGRNIVFADTGGLFIMKADGTGRVQITDDGGGNDDFQPDWQRLPASNPGDGRPPQPIDKDSDGYTAAIDCDDANPTIHPGAADPVGDGIDQDCSGADAAEGAPGGTNGSSGSNGSPQPVGASGSIPVLGGRIRVQWIGRHGKWRIAIISASGLPSGTRISLTCRRRGCPFHRRSVRATKRGVAKLNRVLRRAVFRAGASVRITFTKPGTIARVLLYRVRANKAPVASRRNAGLQAARRRR